MFKKKLTLLFLPLIFIATFIVSLSFQINKVSAQTSTEDPDVIIYFFWGDGCPHCEEAKKYFSALIQEHPEVVIRDFEVWYNADNQKLFQKMATAFGFELRYVPGIFIGDQYWEGYSETIRDQIEKAVEKCLTNGCKNAGQGIIEPGVAEETSSNTETNTPEDAEVITLPFIGEIDLSAQSMTLSTLLIAFIDGFNPCSLWVLSMLLALTLHTGSRRKVIIIGLVFITITALVYALFIAGLFTLFTFVSFLGWIQVVVAIVALFFAQVNIKDYFWYKEGVSFTIDDKKKTGIFHNIRRVMNASQSLVGLVSATVVLAAGVSLVEFSCTAGFPVLWTNLLTAQNVSTAQFILLLILYMFIYQIDELAIFFGAVFTLKASKLEEKQGRILKLIGGMLMLTLAAVMIINPGWMNSVRSTLIIFATAFTAAMLVLLLHRKVLPAFGIWVGTEAKPKKK